MNAATNIARFWPQPWRYEAEGYLSGPCVKDASGQVICAFLWPLHPPAATANAERAMDDLCKAIASINLLDASQNDAPIPGERPPPKGAPQ